MGTITDSIAMAFRDYVTDGIPASGPNEPNKPQIRSIGPIIESAISNVGLGAMVSTAQATRSALNSTLAFPAGAVGLVYADATEANNDLYVKSGASGAGSWTLTTILHSIIAGSVATAMAPYLAEIQDDVDFIADNVDGIAELGSAPALWGKTSAPPANGNGQFGAALTFYRTPVATKGEIKSVTLTSGDTTGDIEIVVGTLSGTTVTIARSATVNVPIASGIAQHFVLTTPLELNAGEYIGIRAAANHIRSTTASTEESGGRWQALGSPSSVSTVSSPITTTRLELQYDITQVDFSAAAARIDDIEDSAEAAQDTADVALSRVDQILASGPLVDSPYGKVSGLPSSGGADYAAATTYYATGLPYDGSVTGVRASGGTTGGTIYIVLGRLSGNTIVEYARSPAITVIANTVDQKLFLDTGMPFVQGDFIGYVTANGAVRRSVATEESGGRYQANGNVTSVSTTAAPGLVTGTRIEAQLIVEHVDFAGTAYTPPAMVDLIGLTTAPIDFIFDGASEAEANHGETGVPTMMNDYFSATFPNFGVGGQTIVQMQNDAATQIDPLIAASLAAGRMAVLWISSGGMYNWINTGATRTGTQAVDLLQNYCAARRAANPGIVIFLENMWHAQGSNFYDESDYLELNNQIASRAIQQGMVDMIVDLRTAQPAGTQDFNDPVYYNADKVHRTTTFNRIIFDMYRVNLSAFLWNRMLGPTLAAQIAALTTRVTALEA